jgi:hypothetical protein
MKDRRILKSVKETKVAEEEASCAWESILDAISDSQGDPLVRKMRKVVLSEETNRIIDLVDDEAARIYLVSNPLPLAVVAIVPKKVIEPVPNPDWKAFSSSGFDSLHSTKRLEPTALSLINPLALSNARSPSLPLPAPVSTSKLARLASTIRRKSSHHSTINRSPVDAPRRTPTTRIISRTIIEIDVDYLDFWLDSILGPNLAPTDLLAPLESRLVATVPNQVTHIQITETYGKVSPPATIQTSTQSSALRSRSSKMSTPPLLNKIASPVTTKSTRSISPVLPIKLPPLVAQSSAPTIKISASPAVLTPVDTPSAFIEHVTGAASAVNVAPVVALIPTSKLSESRATIAPTLPKIDPGSFHGKVDRVKGKKGRRGVLSWFTSKESATTKESANSKDRSNSGARPVPSPLNLESKSTALDEVVTEVKIKRELSKRVKPPVFEEASATGSDEVKSAVDSARRSGDGAGSDSTRSSFVVLEKDDLFLAPLNLSPILLAPPSPAIGLPTIEDSLASHKYRSAPLTHPEYTDPQFADVEDEAPDRSASPFTLVRDNDRSSSPSLRLPRSQRFSNDGKWREAPPSPTSPISRSPPSHDVFVSPSVTKFSKGEDFVVIQRLQPVEAPTSTAAVEFGSERSTMMRSESETGGAIRLFQSSPVEKEQESEKDEPVALARAALVSLSSKRRSSIQQFRDKTSELFGGSSPNLVDSGR